MKIAAKDINYFRIRAPLYMFVLVLITPLQLIILMNLICFLIGTSPQLISCNIYTNFSEILILNKISVSSPLLFQSTSAPTINS